MAYKRRIPSDANWVQTGFGGRRRTRQPPQSSGPVKVVRPAQTGFASSAVRASGSGNLTEKEAVLRMWENRYGQLPADLRRKFNNHRALPAILRYDEYSIGRALNAHKKLDDVARALTGR